MKYIQSKALATAMAKIESEVMSLANKVSHEMMGKTDDETRRDILWAVKTRVSIWAADSKKKEQKMNKKLGEKRLEHITEIEKGKRAIEDVVEGVFSCGGAW